MTTYADKFITEDLFKKKSKMKMEYLATPYTHAQKSIMNIRAAVSDAIAMKLTNQGRLVYAPISSWHHIAHKFDMPTDAKFWERLNLSFLAKCDKLVVIMTPGWKESVGVTDEINFAKEHNIEIEYLDPKPYLKGLKGVI
jgi:hypothetical protein